MGEGAFAEALVGEEYCANAVDLICIGPEDLREALGKHLLEGFRLHEAHVAVRAFVKEHLADLGNVEWDARCVAAGAGDFGVVAAERDEQVAAIEIGE